MAIETPWTTSYPTSQDTPGTEQPNLTDDTVPGTGDGDRSLAVHFHTLRDKLQSIATKVGDDSNLPAGCILSKIGGIVKLDATTAPTVNDDDSGGYGIGSRWVDVTADKEYVCLDATTGAAVWTETTGSGGASTYVGLTDTPGSITALSPQEGNSGGTALVNGPIFKRDATVAPTVNDDSTAGYAVGSRWIDVTADKEYVCLDATATAAVWTETTQSGGGASTYVTLTDTPGSLTALTPQEVNSGGTALVNGPKFKRDATVAPTVNDDNTAGYAVGSRWIDVTADKEYVCLDSSTGAAVWTETTGAGGGATTFVALTDTPSSITADAGIEGNAGGTALVAGPKFKRDATAAPTVNNDNTEGYSVGSRWIDVSADKEYVCSDAATGAAVWTETTASGGGSSTFVGLTDTPGSITALAPTEGNSGGTALVNGPIFKRDATTAPTASDDSGSGYAIGSRWIDVTNDREYVCLDATASAAVWIETTQPARTGENAEIVTMISAKPTTSQSAGSGTSWEDIESPALEDTFTVRAAGTYALFVRHQIFPGSTGSDGYIGLLIDESGYGGHTEQSVETKNELQGFNTGTSRNNATHYLGTVDLEAGTHKVKFRWAYDSGDGTINCDQYSRFNAWCQCIAVSVNTADGNIIDSAVKSADQTGIGTTLTQITNISLNFTTLQDENVKVFVHIPINNGSSNVVTRLLLARIDSGSWFPIDYEVTSYGNTFDSSYVFEDLDAGSHTVDFALKHDLGSFTVYGGGTAIQGYYPAAKTWAKQDRGGYVATENVPQLQYNDASTVDVVKLAGASDRLWMTLSDGRRYYYDLGTLQVDITASGLGGLDTGSEASSTWYQVFAVEDSSNPGQFGVVISASNPETCPTGFNAFKYLGRFYNDSSSDIRKFFYLGCEHHTTNDGASASPTEVLNTTSPTLGAWTALTITSCAPSSGYDALLVDGFNLGGSGKYASLFVEEATPSWTPADDASNGGRALLFNQSIESLHNSRWVPATGGLVYYVLNRGGGNPLYAQLCVRVTGFRDKYLRGNYSQAQAEYLPNPVTASASGPVNLEDTDSGNLYTNEGATAEVVFNLPTAAANLEFTFIVQDSDGIQINADTGDTIRVAGSVSASAGLIETTTIGNTVHLKAINATEWVAISYVGTWTVT